MAKEEDSEVSHDTQSQPVETFGTAPAPKQGGGGGQGPTETFGTAPPSETFGTAPPNETFGTAPAQPPKAPAAPATGSRNMPLLIGIGVAILAVIAVIIGFVAH